MSTRRTFLKASAAVAAAALSRDLFAAEEAKPPIRVGSCAVGFDQAKKAGLDGVELNVGQGDVLPIADPKVREGHKAKMKETGLAVSSFMMGPVQLLPARQRPARSGLAGAVHRRGQGPRRQRHPGGLLRQGELGGRART